MQCIIAQGCKSVSLHVCDMHEANESVRQVILSLIESLVSQSQAIEELKLWNLGCPAEEGEQLLDTIAAHGYTDLKHLDLRQNPAWWTEQVDSPCFTLLKSIL